MATNLINKNAYNLIKLLLYGEFSKEEILENLNIKTPTFYKYTRILKHLGFNIYKKENKYSIKLYKNLVELKDYETSLIAYLKFLSFYFLPYSKSNTLSKFINKISLLATKESIEIIDKKFKTYKNKGIKRDYREKINILQEHINSGNLIKIILASKKELEITPMDFVWKKEKIYLDFIDNSNLKRKAILLSNIVKIMPFCDMAINSYSKETIFELYGKLATSYLLKTEERIIDKFEDKIVVANYSNDKTELFKRLLKYDTYCKVLFPKDDVDEFHKLIEKSLENIK